MYVPITTFNIGYPSSGLETIALILYHSAEKLQEDILTFLHFFLESPSPPRKNEQTRQKTLLAVSDSSSLTWEWAFRLPQDSRFTAKSDRQSQSSRTRLICIASERHDETNLLDKVNAVGTPPHPRWRP